MNNIIRQVRGASHLSSPIEQAVLAVKALCMGLKNEVITTSMADSMYSLESLDVHRQSEVKHTIDSIKAELKDQPSFMAIFSDAIKDAKENDPRLDFALESAARTIIAHGNTSGYYKPATAVMPTDNRQVINVSSLDDDNYTYAMESFDPSTADKYMAGAVVANAMSAIMGEFEDVWFPPILVPPGEYGRDVEIRIPQLYSQQKRDNGGAVFTIQKTSIVDAIITPDVLDAHEIQIYPSTVEDDANIANPIPGYTNKLVSPSIVPTIPQVISGVAFNTRPFAFGVECDAIGISNIGGLITQQIFDQTDQLDRNINLGTVYYTIQYGALASQSCTFAQDVSMQHGSLLMQVASGSQQEYQTNMTATFILTSGSVPVLGNMAALKSTVQGYLGIPSTTDFMITMTARLSAHANINLGTFLANSNNAAIIDVQTGTIANGVFSPANVTGNYVGMLQTPGITSNANLTFATNPSTDITTSTVTPTPINNLVVNQTYNIAGLGTTTVAQWAAVGATIPTLTSVTSGSKYVIASLGTTTTAQWTTLGDAAGTSAVGDVFTAASTGAIPGTGSVFAALASVTAGNTYTIASLGTTTAAQWLALGVPAGTTAAAGTVFVAASTGAITGTGLVTMAPEVTFTATGQGTGSGTVVLLDSQPGIAATIGAAAAAGNFVMTPRGLMPHMRRTNTNLRNTGVIVDNNMPVLYRFAVTLSSPITSLTPIGGSNLVTLDTLGTAAQIRNGGNAVNALLNAQSILKAGGPIPAQNPMMGSEFVVPTYVERTLNVTDMVQSLNSKDALENVRGHFTATLTLMNNQMLVQSRYLAALKALNFGADDFETIVVTDPKIAPHLMVSGDPRSLGNMNNYKITVSNNAKLLDKVFMSFRLKNRTEDLHPLNFGAMLMTPSLTFEAPITQNNRVANNVITIPRVNSYVFLPIMAVLNVQNLNALYTSAESILGTKVTPTNVLYQ